MAREKGQCSSPTSNCSSVRHSPLEFRRAKSRGVRCSPNTHSPDPTREVDLIRRAQSEGDLAAQPILPGRIGLATETLSWNCDQQGQSHSEMKAKDAVKIGKAVTKTWQRETCDSARKSWNMKRNYAESRRQSKCRFVAKDFRGRLHREEYDTGPSAH